MQDLGDSLQITIPAVRHPFAILFLPIWLTFWTVGGLFAGSALLTKFEPGLLLWLVGWAVGFVFASATLVWMLVGKEKIEISTYSIISRHQVFGLGRSKEYLAEHIQDLRALPTVGYPGFGWGSQRASFWGFQDGMLAFDYGAKTFRLAGGIDEAEAKQILAAIQQRFPQYRHPRNEINGKQQS